MRGLPGWLRDATRTNPVRFVDIGARGGWQPKWQANAELVTFVGFEPDRVECERLRSTAKANEHYLADCLADAPGTATLYICDPPSRSSLYEPDLEAMDRILGIEDATRLVGTQELEVTTLDRALAPLNLGSIDCMKLDTQGSELDILRGAVETLEGPTIALEVEAEFTPMYREQPLFHDIAAFLRTRGFELLDFPTLYSTQRMRFMDRGRHGYAHVGQLAANWASRLETNGRELIYADAVFVREPEAWTRALGRHGNAARGIGLRAIVALCVLGYHARAAKMAAILHDCGWVTPDELAQIHRFVAETTRPWRRIADESVAVTRRLLRRLRNLRR